MKQKFAFVSGLEEKGETVFSQVSGLGSSESEIGLSKGETQGGVRRLEPPLKGVLASPPHAFTLGNRKKGTASGLRSLPLCPSSEPTPKATKADYERRLRRAEEWFSAVEQVITVEKSDEFQRRYCELADDAHAAFPGIVSRCFEFGPDERLHFSRWNPWRRE